MKNPKFQIFKSGNSEFYFRLRARNGEPILHSEGYTTKPACENGINSVKENAQVDYFESKINKGGDHYFLLKAANGQVIGKSEQYNTEQAMQNGIQAVIEVAGNAPIEDLTL
jgi:uncharacterized protein YegP (UPF0339 family)